MTRDPSPRTDVCVVGAGPAGGLVASTLAEQGHEVVVLEAGPRFDRRQDQERMERSIRPSFDEPAVWDMGGPRDAFTSSGPRFYPLNRSRVKGVGGTTLHWQGMVMRLHESDFAGEVGDRGLPAWPIEYEELRPYYAQAEAALGVAGASDNPFAPPREQPHPLPPFPPSYSDSIFAQACDRLGIAVHSVPNARTSEAYQDRAPCAGYGTCQPVCPIGAKYSADVHVQRAESAGARVIDRAPVHRLRLDREGRVDGARYATPQGEEHLQTARHFVLAAGGVEIPRLLLLSRSDRFPDGLANRSGLVGRYFTEHVFAGAGGRIDRRTRQNHIGFLTSESHQFYDDPGRGTDGSGGGISPADGPFNPIKLEFLNYAGPSPVELALTAETWGDDLLADLRDAYGHAIALGGLVGQTPRKENRVTLDASRTDDHGNPVPEVQWSIDPRTRRTVSRANEIQHAILEELGADVRWTVGPANTGPAFHHMGTTRMGTAPSTSVVGPDLRTHDVPNLYIASSSVFPAPGAMNPTLTIAALALRVADRLDERL